MTEADIFTFLYPFVPVVGLLGCGPQILTLLRLKQQPRSFSFASWFIWLASWCIAMGYSHFVIQDALLTLAAGINVSVHITTLSVAGYKHYKYAKDKVRMVGDDRLELPTLSV